MKNQLTLEKLESKLWDCANYLRGSIDSSEYKHYIFGLLFLKRVSDVFVEKREQIIDQYGEQASQDKDLYDFFVPDEARFDFLLQQAINIGEYINKAFEKVEEENTKLQWVLSSIDFNDEHKLNDKTIKQLVDKMNELDLSNSNLQDPDILGRAYEYMIRKFADDSGKKWGEFYTPQEVVHLLTRLADIEPHMSICDPAVGSGGILVSAVRELQKTNAQASTLELDWQESNRNTWAICKLNMFLHGISSATIKHGNTLTNPQLLNGTQLKKYDRVLANPPGNGDYDQSHFKNSDNFDRNKYGLPPKNKADWIWIQHMLASLKPDGKLGIVLDNGALFRSRSEGKIRKKVLQNDLIEAVIALPSNLFYNTSSPGCILVLNKDKPEPRQNKVLFIYAEEQKLRNSDVQIYKELSNQNQLTKEGIAKIYDTYQGYKTEDHHSRVVDMDEIAKNDYNLNIPRYVDTTQPEEKVDIQSTYDELQNLEKEQKTVDDQLKDYLDQLGYNL